MKKQTMIALVAVFALLGGISLRSQSVERGHKHQVVVLWASQSGVPTFINGQYHYVYDGARVYCSSSSSNAPTFPQQFGDFIGGGTQVADVLAQLLDDGFRIVNQDNNGFHFLLIR